MKFVRPPRCPEHPEYDVSLEFKVVPRWRCAACHRLLGAAGADRELWLESPWHHWRWRKLPAQSQACGVIDYAWCAHLAVGRLPQRRGGEDVEVDADDRAEINARIDALDSAALIPAEDVAANVRHP